MNYTKENFKRHKMYRPNTGEAVMAGSFEKHLKLKEMGYGHSKPAKKKTAKKGSKTSFTEAVNKRMGGGY